ncbi:hypothetical protein ACFLYZ_01540 [Thermodesulfobacteriota bacterium]
MDKEKKQAAAIAAVTLYLKAEQEAAAMQAAAAAQISSVSHAAPPLKVWGLSGRQAQMQMRNMMQMKTFK